MVRGLPRMAMLICFGGAIEMFEYVVEMVGEGCYIFIYDLGKVFLTVGMEALLTGFISLWSYYSILQ